MTDHEKLCKEFCKLTGRCWHEWDGVKTPDFHEIKCTCGYSEVTFLLNKHINENNPTYENPADVLRVIIKDLGFVTTSEFFSLNRESKEMIDVDMILEKDALLKAAVNWLKEGKK